MKRSLNFNEIWGVGYFFEDKLLEGLKEKGFALIGNRGGAEAVNGFTRVIIQCFKLDSLIYHRPLTDFHLTLLLEK